MGEDEGPPALRPRDGFAVIVCLLGMALALQTSQSVFVSDTWRFRGGPGNGGGSMFGRVEEERVPPPLITDMDGDGINDVVIATREPAVVVLSGSPLAVGEAGSPPHARPHQNGAHQTVGWRVIAKRSLLARVDVPSGRQPVAMAVDVSSPEGGVIVLTDGWVVLSFDKSLRLRWEVTVNPFMDKFMAADPLTRQQLVFREAVVHVLAHGLAVGGSQNSTDSSVVLVGGSVHAPPRDKLDGSAAREPHFREPSVFHGLSIDEEDALRHYSVYALQPDTGGVVWRHEASVLDDLEGGAEGSKSSLHDDESSRDRRSLGDYKLVRRHKEGHTSGGRGCARHRLDVMRALPHAWSHREDTKLTPLTLHRRPKRHTTQSGTVNSQQASGGSFMHPVDGVLAQSHNSRDVKDDGSPPNVILLHGQHGIEVVHLKSGKEVCRLPLTGADMYLDVNGDGNVDHVHVNGARDGWAKVKGPLQPHVPGCLVKVSSHGARGASRQLFNGSLCLRARPAKQLTKATIGLSSVPKSVANVEVAPGLAVASSDRRAEQWWTFFFVSPGIVTGFNNEGRLMWQVDALVTGWDISDSSPWAMGHYLPSVTAFTLYAEAEKPGAPSVEDSFLVVVGDTGLALLSAAWGSRILMEALSEPVVLKPVFGDVNGDGVQDIVLVHANVLQCFIVGETRGSLPMLIVLGSFLAVVAAVSIVQRYPHLLLGDDEGRLRQSDAFGARPSGRARPASRGPWYKRRPSRKDA